MQKKVLLPTDFSNNALNAIEYALKLYANESCVFYLLNSTKVKASRVSSFSNKLSETIYENAKKDMLNLKEKLEKINTGENHHFEILISNSDLQDALQEAIAIYKVQMVVMGTKGASGAKEFFFGSNTINVINKIKNCPVLTIPDMYRFTEPKKIAFPTDFNRICAEKEVKPLKGIADLYNSEINIVHLNNEEEFNTTQEKNYKILKGYLKDYKHYVFWIPNYGKKADDINEFIEKQHINMLVMVNYKHSFIEKITREPVIKTIGFQSVIPFLVVPQ